MGATVDTRVCPRRVVRYPSPDDIVSDARRLVDAGAATTGNWQLAEIVDHLATGIDLMIEGFGSRAPWYVRLVGRVFLKRRILAHRMPPRLPFPADSNVQPFITGIDGTAALEHLHRSTEKLKATKQFPPHPVFGQLTRNEVLQLHCRHAELHMSFVQEPGELTVEVSPAARIHTS